MSEKDAVDPETPTGGFPDFDADAGIEGGVESAVELEEDDDNDLTVVVTGARSQGLEGSPSRDSLSGDVGFDGLDSDDSYTSDQEDIDETVVVSSPGVNIDIDDEVDVDDEVDDETVVFIAPGAEASASGVDSEDDLEDHTVVVSTPRNGPADANADDADEIDETVVVNDSAYRRDKVAETSEDAVSDDTMIVARPSESPVSADTVMVAGRRESSRYMEDEETGVSTRARRRRRGNRPNQNSTHAETPVARLRQTVRGDLGVDPVDEQSGRSDGDPWDRQVDAATAAISEASGFVGASLESETDEAVLIAGTEVPQSLAKLLFKKPLDPKRRAPAAPFPLPQSSLPRGGVRTGVPVAYGANSVVAEMQPEGTDFARWLGPPPMGYELVAADRDRLPSTAKLNRNFRIAAFVGGAAVVAVSAVGIWWVATQLLR